MTPAARPKVSAVPGNASATVYWTIPAANGSAITNYFVTPYIGGRAQTPIELGVVRSAHITGLTNAKSYEFHVAAKNAEGTGPTRSSPSITVGAPVAPTGVRGLVLAVTEPDKSYSVIPTLQVVSLGFVTVVV